MSKRKKSPNQRQELSLFRGRPDYKSAFSEAVSALIAEKITDRTERMRRIAELTDEYVAATGERPDVSVLERLANAVLHEELTDKSPDKMTREEYPIMSDIQLARRQAGVHQRIGARQKGESSLSLASDYGSDGENYRYPGRRKRTIDEQIWIDQATSSRNHARRKTYQRLAKPSRVVSYKIGEEASVSDNVRKDMGFIIGA